MWQKIETNEKNVSYRTVVTVVSGVGCSTGIQEISSQLVTFWTLSSLKRFFQSRCWSLIVQWELDGNGGISQTGGQWTCVILWPIKNWGSEERCLAVLVNLDRSGAFSCNLCLLEAMPKGNMSFKNLWLWEADPEALGASGSGGKLVYLTDTHFDSQTIGATTTTTWVGENGAFMSNGSLPGDFGSRCGFFTSFIV